MTNMQKIFDRVLDMPSISKVVQELIQSFNDPRANVDDITKKIRMDQALSAKVLRLANSARYGAGRKVASIDSAVVMLGFDALKTLVVASGVSAAFRKVPHLDMKEYWRETFLVANVSKYIAKHAKLDGETAFTCGLMHSVGEVLLYMADGDAMLEIDALSKEGANRIHLEVKRLGVDYAQVGEELAKRWKFPDQITHAVGQHAHVVSEKSPDPYAVIVHLARHLAKARLNNLSKQDISASFPVNLAEPLKIDMAALMDEIDRLLTQEDDIDQVLAA